MKTLPLDLTPVTIQKLFNEGQCLTYGYNHISQINYEMDLAYDFKQKNHLKNAWVVSKIATLASDFYNEPFHFFSNGVLIHHFDPTKDNSVQFERIERVIKLHGYQIKKIYGPQSQFEFFAYDSFLKQISDFAALEYPPEAHLEAVKIPDKKTFVKKCLEKGAVLLTSSQNSGIDPMVRNYIALLDDGSFYVSEDYSNRNAINDPSIPTHFMREYPNFYYLKRRYVPQSYLAALDEEAKKFDWYLSSKESVVDKNPKREFSEFAMHQLDEYIKKLLNGRKCISITNPNVKPGDYKPDHDTYVLFDDGKLIISKALISPADRFLIESLKHAFANLTPDTEYVPSYYIDFIYREVAKTQKTANQIYIEMLKQKAKRLKKILNIPHHEALETVSQMVGFKSFKEALKMSEQNARYAISREQKEKSTALERGKDYVFEQYTKWKKE